jgi:hypothetical protein
MDIISTLITAFVGLIGVWLGSYLTKRNTIKTEKQFLMKKLRLEKIQSICINLLDYIRTIAKIHSLVVQYEKKEISHEEFKIKNDQFQEDVTEYFRFLTANEIFLTGIQMEVEKLNDKYQLICNKIYEKYHNPQTRKVYFDEEEKTYESINNDFEHCLLIGNDIIQKLNKILYEEINELNK